MANEIPSTTEQVIAQTKKWVADVVIGCNFCPFANKEVKLGALHYQVEEATNAKTCLEAFLNECIRLDEHPEIHTTLLILTKATPVFDDYLGLVSMAEKLLRKKGYEGTYQVASFHPLYCFAGADDTDAANYTNRSIYPMLHLLREEQVEQVRLHYPDIEQIPNKNIEFAQKKGLAHMRALRDACL